MFKVMLDSLIMIAIIMSLGYYLQKKDILTDDVRKNVTYILLNICLPATFFMSFQVERTPDKVSAIFVVVGLSFLMHFVFFIFGHILARILNTTRDEEGVLVFSLAFKNLTYMGMPIILAMFSDYDPNFYVTLFCIPFNILTFSLAPILLSSEKGVKLKFSNFINNVNIAIVAGIVFFLLNIKIPTPIGDAFNTIAQLTIPASLLMTGALLTKSDLKSIFYDKKIIIITLVNLLVLPTVFYIIVSRIDIEKLFINISIVMSVLPSASLTVILTDKYNGNIDFAGKLVLATTIFSLFSIILFGIVLT